MLAHRDRQRDRERESHVNIHNTFDILLYIHSIYECECTREHLLSAGIVLLRECVCNKIHYRIVRNESIRIDTSKYIIHIKLTFRDCAIIYSDSTYLYTAGNAGLLFKRNKYCVCVAYVHVLALRLVARLRMWMMIFHVKISHWTKRYFIKTQTHKTPPRIMVWAGDEKKNQISEIKDDFIFQLPHFVAKAKEAKKNNTAEYLATILRMLP